MSAAGCDGRARGVPVRWLGAAVAAFGEARLAISLFGLHGALVAVGSALATLLLVGVPAAIIDNPLFIRMTPVRAQDYAIWLATGLIMGLIAGTFVAPVPGGGPGPALSGGVLSFLAVGCPICNKLVVLLLGVSGALTLFGPAQVYVGIVALGLLIWTFRVRVRTIARACAVPATISAAREDRRDPPAPAPR